MLQTIFKYEWKQLLRSKGVLAALLLFGTIAVFCLQQGQSIYTFQQKAIDSATAKYQRNYKKVQAVFDTLTYTNPGIIDLEEPFSLEWQLQDVKAKEVSPLSILTIGQSDIYTPLMSGQFNKPIFKNDFAEFQNPEKLLVGNLDMSFFVLFIFPLLFIALAYNVRSADSEAGISPLLSTQVTSIVQLLNIRLFFRWLISMLPLIAGAIASLVVVAKLDAFSMLSWLQWWGVALLYALFWLFLGVLMLRFRLSSLVNAIAFTSIWILLLVAIPGLLNTWFNYKFPSTNKTELAEYRDYDFKAWDQPFELQEAFLLERYPRFKELNLANGMDSIKFKSFGYALMVYEKEKQLYNQMSAQKNRLASAEQNSFWLNPAGGVMRSLATISKTGLQAQQQFEEKVLAYRENKLKYLFEKLVTQPHFTKQDFEGMPKMADGRGKNGFMSNLLPLLLLTIICMVLGILFRGKFS
ncbi:MAG: DUF3526 domain-containing protein [Bacteroidetes bacterium]|nr:MAG: DUF3526 domain-containing protein [Bacteroidota bacterium]